MWMTSSVWITAGFSTLSSSNLKPDFRRTTPSFLTFTIIKAFFKFAIVKASYDTLDYPLGFVRAAHAYGECTRFHCRVIISARENGIANKYHLPDFNIQHIAQLMHTVLFVDPLFGYIDRCRPTEIYRKLRDQFIPSFFELISFGKIRGPF